METIEDIMLDIESGCVLRELTKDMTSKEKIDYFQSLKPVLNMTSSERLIYLRSLTEF